MPSGIYLVEHKISGKRYVGRSTNIRVRWQQHISDARSGRTKNPLHHALRKYGSEAFTWRILLSAPDRLHSVLEAQFISDWNTLRPSGYNVGGSEGGFPSQFFINTMGPAERERWQGVMSRVSKAGAAGLKALRQDPDYEKQYRAVKSAASAKREANIKAKCAADPEYAAKEKLRRSTASKKNPKTNAAASSATFKQRMVEDPEYAARVRANRARAGAARWARLRERTAAEGGKDASLA